MSLRSRAREIVFQVLYQQDANPEQTPEDIQEFVRNRLHNVGDIHEFAQQLLEGTQQHLPQIDEQLSAAAKNWKLGRMAVTDRNILRLGAFEILFFDTPNNVAINEAIELAKRYGDSNSPAFVNGILDRLTHA